MLQAALQSGELTFEKTVLYHATVMLTQLYRHTLGNANEGVFLASEAGHRNHGSEQP